MIYSRRALTTAWIALVVITVGSFAVADSSGYRQGWAAVVVIAAALAKSRVVLVRYMGFRTFPLAWQMFFDAWLLVNAGVIVGFHLAA